MYLEIITPDKKVFSGEVVSVAVPGSAGQFQMLNNHAPIISSLVNGTVKVKTATGNQQFEVKGGVVEMLDNKITLLAESV
ncbi:MAG: ATP synthase F1 subunit epsilon [Bacteroidota bacterium]|jgi:F-type H+-transporting ATPase subunit epsilon